MDDSGNTDTKTRTVIVQNNIKPTITIAEQILLITIWVYLIMTKVLPQLMLRVGNQVTVTSTNNVNIDILGSYQVNYTATDTFGNTQTAIRTVNVVDLAGPIIILLGDNPMTIELNSTYVEPGANAYDRINLEEDLTLDGGNQIREELEPGGPLEKNRNLSNNYRFVDTSTPGTYIITYTATDNQNNSSSKTRSVIVENNQNPTITLAGDNPFLLSQGNNYIEPGVSAVDALGNILQVTSTNNINNNVLGIYTVTYLATDSYGNSATCNKNC